MQESRFFPIKKKAIIIFNKMFPIFSDVDVGDKGQIEITGIIEGEELEMQEEGSEIFIKNIRIEKAEIINGGKIKI